MKVEDFHGRIRRKTGIGYNSRMTVIKNLLFLAFFIPFFASAAPASTAPVCAGDEGSAKSFNSIEHSRERYRDFFRRRDEKEADEEMRNAGITALARQRETEAYEREQALKTFLKQRKPVVEDPRLEKQWEEDKKAEKEQMELQRRRFVQTRDCIRKVEKQRQTIPENEEYELDQN
jgi:hypothetical protein